MTTTSTAPDERHRLESEFEHEPVPTTQRRSLRSVSAVWFGFPRVFTDAVFDGTIVYGLGFWEIGDGRMVPSSAWLGFTQPMNLTGQPATSGPAGFTRLPVGLQIAGRHLADGDVLRAAAAYEQAAPWADRYPETAR